MVSTSAAADARQPAPHISEAQRMRQSIIEMGFRPSDDGNEGGIWDDDTHVTPREKELAEMVMRLSSLAETSAAMDSEDLVARLLQERQFQAQQFDDERQRWEADRQAWMRTAAVLIAKGATTFGTPAREEEMERATAILEGDNQDLHLRIHSDQMRMNTLESELARLRPLLLMQPYALTHSHPVASSRQDSITVKNLNKDEDRSSGAPASPQKRGDYYRRHPVPPPVKAPPKIAPPAPALPSRVKKSLGRDTALTADARSEHLLLAARCIGRRRAGLLSAEADIEAAANDKRRSFQQAQPNYSVKTSEASTSSLRRSPSAGQVAAASTSNPPRTPRRDPPVAGSSRAPVTPRAVFSTANQQSQSTPLDSLVSAAMMFSGEGSPSKARQQEDESPSPAKRRRVADLDKHLDNSKENAIERRLSALDVLADQAFYQQSSAPPSPEPNRVQTRSVAATKAPPARENNYYRDRTTVPPGSPTPRAKGKAKAAPNGTLQASPSKMAQIPPSPSYRSFTNHYYPSLATDLARRREAALAPAAEISSNGWTVRNATTTNGVFDDPSTISSAPPSGSSDGLSAAPPPAASQTDESAPRKEGQSFNATDSSVPAFADDQSRPIASQPFEQQPG